MPTSKGLNQFAKRMEVVSELFNDNVNKAVRRAAIKADEAAVLTTPVDTGRARANWVTSIGQPDVSEQSLNNNPLSQAGQVIPTWKLGAGPIFIVNSVPYIIPLDDGSSDQAPGGMSQFAIQAAQQELNKIKLLGK